MYQEISFHGDWQYNRFIHFIEDRAKDIDLIYKMDKIIYL